MRAPLVLAALAPLCGACLDFDGLSRAFGDGGTAQDASAVIDAAPLADGAIEDAQGSADAHPAVDAMPSACDPQAGPDVIVDTDFEERAAPAGWTVRPYGTLSRSAFDSNRSRCGSVSLRLVATAGSGEFGGIVLSRTGVSPPFWVRAYLYAEPPPLTAGYRGLVTFVDPVSAPYFHYDVMLEPTALPNSWMLTNAYALPAPDGSKASPSMLPFATGRWVCFEWGVDANGTSRVALDGGDAEVAKLVTAVAPSSAIDRLDIGPLVQLTSAGGGAASESWTLNVDRLTVSTTRLGCRP